jgi:hypothetical protein
MQINTSIALSINSQANDSAWDRAIMDAESEIQILARKLARLRRAVLIFKANKRDGVQWPGEENTDAATR